VPLEAQDASYFAASARIASLRAISKALPSQLSLLFYVPVLSYATHGEWISRRRVGAALFSRGV
jgi:hypothetical protein